jgi:hypothetical protein
MALAGAAGAGGALRLHVFLGRVYEIAFRIAIMMANLGHVEGQAVFVAALADEIEEVIRPVQTAWAALLLAWENMKWYTMSLAAAIEEIGQRYLAPGWIEFVPPLHPFPGQGAALAAQLIAPAGELFLFGQELAARGEPFDMWNDIWVSYFYRAASHGDPPWMGLEQDDFLRRSSRRISSLQLPRVRV